MSQCNLTMLPVEKTSNSHLPFSSVKCRAEDRLTDGDVHPGSRAYPPKANSLNAKGGGCFKRGGPTRNLTAVK